MIVISGSHCTINDGGINIHTYYADSIGLKSFLCLEWQKIDHLNSSRILSNNLHYFILVLMFSSIFFKAGSKLKDSFVTLNQKKIHCEKS